MNHIVHSITACIFACLLLSGCEMENDNLRNEALLDSARVEMLVNMDYEKAKSIYKDILKHTRNKLTRLLADEGMMQLCQIRSHNKTYYDYRTDALKLIREFKTAEKHIDQKHDSILQQAKKNFYRISAVYYITLRDIEQTFEMLDSIKDKPMGKQAFLAEYLGRESMYYRSLQKVWTADSLTEAGQYEEALDNLSSALHLINLHHQKYSFSGFSDTLSIYNETSSDTLSSEMRWIQNPDCVCIPDWMAAVREQLSITFGAMGNKPASDYNHNIYFDILDATRQDRILEQQLDTLQSHEQRLNIMLIALCLFTILAGILGTRIYRRKKQSSLLQQQQLHREIENHITTLLPRWLQQNGGSISQIQDEMEYADDERRAAEMKIEKNKRGYIDKATSVSIANGIIPFLDRAIREIDSPNCNIAYLSELIDKINDYNDILGHWVKIRQGSVTLNIESFPLSTLFDVARKAHALYASEGLSLEVVPTDSVVKADKALTLFMINTLMDNARKFTPMGGSVKVFAEQTPTYVEISVSDTGYGMSEDDTREVVKKKKGHGFGLMNCRGIIEKYKKTNPLFSVCSFGVESKIGEGSRFYFRLPVKIITSLLLFLFSLLPAAANATVGNSSSADSSELNEETMTEGIRLARAFADSVYYCNTHAEYARAIEFGDSVLTALNMHYIATTGKTDNLLQLEGELSDMPEIKLWKDGFDTDFDVIIGVRNEIAIAALAMHRKHLYRYNCDVFTRLFQLISHDNTTSEVISRLERTNNNKSLILNLSVLLLFLLLLIIVLYYYHQYMLPLFNLREISKLDETLLCSSDDKVQNIIRSSVNEIITIDDMQILPVGMSVIENDESITLPLTVDLKESVYPLGTLYITSHQQSGFKSQLTLLKYIASHLAIALYCTSAKIEDLKTQLELKQDEQHRAEADNNRIHVQNMILDNCLSSIKHETMYYPNRIKLMLKQNCDTDIDKTAISELLHYYKEVFTLMSGCAMKQLEQTAFKRRVIKLKDIINIIERVGEERGEDITIKQHDSVAETDRIICDPIMLQYLFDTLINSDEHIHESKAHSPLLNVEISTDHQFCTFCITDFSKDWDEERASTLFYPDSLRYNSETDQLQGAEYILCKQIIREHDEHCGIRGCRIYAEAPDRLTFTLPLKY